MSYRQQLTWLTRYREKKNRERILNKLDLAESFQIAYLASQPVEKGKFNKNVGEFKRWRKRLIRQAYPERKQYTFWDMVDKKKKRLILN